jgi:hypothetical protein
MMIRKGIVLALLFAGFFASIDSYSQDTEPVEKKKSKGRPDIPGTFVVEFGFNQPVNRPDSLFDLGFWGSRTINIYYQYDVRIGNSKFSVHPGVGFGLERYKLNNYYTLGYVTDVNTKTVEFVPAWTDYPGVKKSMIVANYIDIPLEIRFSTNPEDPGRSFRASIGGRVGYLFDSFTKIKYKNEGETKKIKDKQNFNLNDFRYGAFVKIGGGNFSVFCHYNISPVFQKDRGPQKTEMNNLTVGISLSSF